MQNQYLITADINGTTYFVKIIESELLGKLISYEGLKENASQFDDWEIAVENMLAIDTEHRLAVQSPSGKPEQHRVPFPERLKQLRGSIGLSQAAMADKIGLGRGAYEAHESGRAFPSHDMLHRYAKFYGLSIEELIKGNRHSVDAK